MKQIDFSKFNTGTLFLIRTPDTFPVGYAETCFEDMKRLHLDYASWLETWNCMDGIIWPHPDYPRSSFWKDSPRDPLEETFQAADNNGMVFMPEAGVMHDAYINAHPDDMWHVYGDDTPHRYGRIGFVPSSPLTADYFIAKYDAMLDKYGHHPSCKGICMPCENSVALTYDIRTREAYRNAFGSEMPKPEEIWGSRTIEEQVYRFLEHQFLVMYQTLAKHLKQKYGLPMMHYPLSAVSNVSHMLFIDTNVRPARNLSVMTQVNELSMLNLQLHPPLGDNLYQFKLEVELLQGLCGDLPNMADTHFYHETNRGHLPDATPKRYVDDVLATLTPFGVSFFCYGFFAKELPLWKKELNPGAKVFEAYSKPEIVAVRRKYVAQALDYVENLRPLLEDTRHTAACGIYWTEDIDMDYQYGSYYREHLFGLYELCQATALPTTIVTTIPQDASVIKILVLDNLRSFSAEQAQALKHYLEAGGKVFLIGDCTQLLQETCGMNIGETHATFVCDPQNKHFNHWLFNIPSATRCLTEQNGHALFKYNNGLPAITQLGNVIYFGCTGTFSMFPMFKTMTLSLMDLWKQLMHEQGGDSGITIKAPYLSFQDAHLFITSDLFKSTDGKRLVLLIRNLGVEVNGLTLDWKLPEGFKVVQAFSDGASFSFEDNAPMPQFEHYAVLEARKA